MSETSILTAKNLKKSWPSLKGPVEVLRGVSLEVAPGETLAIIGPSGSGKSTLLTILATLDRASSGELSIQGVDIQNMEEAMIRQWRSKSLGIIFQQFHLMTSLTALENVELPLEIRGEKNIRDKAKKALEAVGLGHRLDHLPSMLSGGECQRVAIARAIVSEPKVILADEPSGSLDEETGEQVTQLMFDLVQKNKMSLIVVTHNPDLAKRCNRTLKMHNGHLETVDL